MNKDVYANRFNVHLSETIAGTARFVEVPTYANAFSKEAFVIHKLEYAFSQTDLDSLVANQDGLVACLSTANHMSSIAIGAAFPEPGIIDMVQIMANLRGAAATLFLRDAVVTHDLSTLPGGGIIVPARPLFVGVQGIGLGAAVTVDVRGWFTKVDLKDQEFIELVDAYRLIR